MGWADFFKEIMGLGVGDEYKGEKVVKAEKHGKYKYVATETKDGTREYTVKDPDAKDDDDKGGLLGKLFG